MATKRKKEEPKDPNLDPWPQRARFKELYEKYRRSFTPRKKMPDVAIELGCEYNTLYSNIYDKKRPRPLLSTLIAASRLFQCDLGEFVDNPGMQIEGLGNLGDLSEEARVALRKIHSKLKEMTPNEINDLMTIFDAATMAIGRKR